MKPVPKEQRYSFRSFFQCFLGLAWVLSILAITCLLVMFVIPPFSISPQTTYLTEPRSKEFYGIDYQAFIIEQLDPGVPPEDNGFRLLVETFGRSLFDDKLEEQHWHRICEYLELSPNIEPKHTFVDWWTYQNSLPPEEGELVKTTSHSDVVPPWSEEAMPIVARWIDEHNAAIDMFITAIQMPVLYLPPMFDENPISPVLVNEDTWRRMRSSLLIRARYQLTTGSIDEAWNDVLAIYRLAELHRPAVWCWMSALANNGTVDTANRYAEAVMIHSDWASDEIRQRIEAIMPFQRQFSESEIRIVFRNQRLMTLDYIQRIANEGLLFEERVQCCPPGRHPAKAQRPASAFEEWWKKRAGRFMRLGLAMIEVNKHCDDREYQFFNDLPETDRWTFDKYEPFRLIVWHGTTGVGGVGMGHF